jgi:hypothetical protein
MNRNFRVTLRLVPFAEPKTFDVEVTPGEVNEMAEHGPIVPVLNAHVIEAAKKLAPVSLGWWGDSIEEIPAQ